MERPGWKYCENIKKKAHVSEPSLHGGHYVTKQEHRKEQIIFR